MTTQEDAMRRALEVLENGNRSPITTAANILRTALAQQGEKQPVAWYDEEFDCAYTSAELDGGASDWLIPLYTAAPAPQPKGLFIDMITEHGPEFVAEIAAIGETAPQPAQSPLYRLMRKDGAAWLPASEWFTEPEAGWHQLVKGSPENWRIGTSLDGKQIANAFAAALQSAQPVSANIQTKIVKDISAHEGGKQQSSPLPTTEPDARGCAYCNHTLFLGSKCKNCGKEVK